MKNILKFLGFRKDWVYETIVTTEYNSRAHAAPMGISSTDYKKILLEVYKSAETCRNISETGFFAVNLTDDLSIYYSSLFDRKKIRYIRPKGFIVPAIKGADAFIEARVVSEKEAGEKIIFAAEVICFKKTGKKEIKLINRAQSLAMEALIKATKVRAAKDAAKKKQLIEELRYIAHAASKTAPGSRQARMASKLSSLFRC
jgi:hypothetical protein